MGASCCNLNANDKRDGCNIFIIKNKNPSIYFINEIKYPTYARYKYFLELVQS